MTLAVALAAVVVAGGAAVAAAWVQRPEAPQPDPTTARPTVPTATTPPTPSPTPTIEPIVLAISIDGFNPESLQILGRQGTPNLHRLISEGASTLNARTAVEQTVTLPNHTGMLTGRRISGSDGHGVTVNSDPGGTLASRHGSYIPGMFDVAHDNGLSTGLFAQKSKFSFFSRSWDSRNGAPDTTGEDNGRDKTDIDLVRENAPVIEGVSTALRDQSADLMFMHMRALDRAGHSDGWLGSKYLSKVREVDAQLGQLLAVVDQNPEVKERLTILLTADHGGPKGKESHNKRTLAQNYTIPFIAWGRGVEPGANLYALNSGRKDPGGAQVGYDGTQPIRNIDIEGTALSILGLPKLDGVVSSNWPTLKLH